MRLALPSGIPRDQREFAETSRAICTLQGHCVGCVGATGARRSRRSIREIQASFAKTRYLIFSRILFSLHENCKQGGYEWAKRTGDQATELREDFRPSRGSRGLNVRFNVLFFGWKLRVAIVWQARSKPLTARNTCAIGTKHWEYLVHGLLDAFPIAADRSASL